MSYKSISVDVDIDLDEWDDDELVAELEARAKHWNPNAMSHVEEGDAWRLGRALRNGDLTEARHILEPLLAKHGIAVK